MAAKTVVQDPSSPDDVNPPYRLSEILMRLAERKRPFVFDTPEGTRTFSVDELRSAGWVRELPTDERDQVEWWCKRWQCSDARDQEVGHA